MKISEKMLILANVKQKDIVYDPGCGEGIIVILAAKRFGARGVGIDIDPRRIKEARVNAHKEGVEHLTTFIQGNIKDIDISKATVVAMYLHVEAEYSLRKKFEKELKPGTRIVSHTESYFRKWTPIKTKTLTDDNGFLHTIYLWQIGNKNKTPSTIRNDLVNASK